MSSGESAALLLAATPFYAEQGGQVGDAGTVATPSGVFRVDATQRLGDAVLHVGAVEGGTIKVGEPATAERNEVDRADIVRNHTATHLLNLTLREVLGEHVAQKGSLVDADKTRFDFAHDKPLTRDEVREIERRVNDALVADIPVVVTVRPLDEAKRIPGVRAVFGEKYPDPVRVVAAGESVEFCGGTHAASTGGVGLFRVVAQEGVAKGVRRITAVTGRRAAEESARLAALVEDLTATLQCSEAQLQSRVSALQAEVKALQSAVKKGQSGNAAATVDQLLAGAPDVNGTKLVVGELPGASAELARAQVDRVRQLTPSSFVVFAWADEGKVAVVAALSRDLVAKGLKAGDVVKQVAQVVGGTGGGKPDIAQAGGKDAAKLPEALQKALELGRELLG